MKIIKIVTVMFLCISVMVLATLAKGEVSEKQQRLINVQWKMICTKGGLLGFSEEGLTVCYLSVKDNKDGVLIVGSAAGNSFQKFLVRNLIVSTGGFRFDLIEEKTNKQESYCDGYAKGFALSLTFHTMNDDSRFNVLLVPTAAIRDVLKIGDDFGKDKGRVDRR